MNILKKSFFLISFSSFLISTRSLATITKMSNFNVWKGSSSNSVADVYMFPMLQDNYGYLLVDPNTKKVACIDPGDGPAVLNALDKLKFPLDLIICTHKHSDHIGGNSLLKSNFPDVKIISGAYDNIPETDIFLNDNDEYNFGSLKIKVIHAPCHTKGHVLYYIPTSTPSELPILFSGDTLFVGGCGRFFEGTAAEMLENMDKISSLPISTQVFCAHEYTESNFKFLAHIDPEKTLQKYEDIKVLRKDKNPTVPTSIEQELKFNLFMQCHDLSLQSKLGVSTAVDAMTQLRLLKNSF